MYRMFSGCTAENINLSGFNTDLVTNMKEMFRNVYNVSDLDLSSFNMNNVTSCGYMFLSAKISSLKMMGLPIESTNVSTVMFNNVTTTGIFYYNKNYDYSLIISVLPSTWTSVPV